MPDVATLALAKAYTNSVALGSGAIRGPKGDKGDIGIAKEIELQSNGNFIQYRYIGDTAWINVIPLSDLKGDKGHQGDEGTKGDDGKDAELPEFRVEENVLQYKFPSQTDDEWVNIYTFEFEVEPVDLSPIESRLDNLEKFNTDKIGDMDTLVTTSKQVVGSINELKTAISEIEVSPTLSDEDRIKLDTIITDGDGTKYLSDDGTYKTIEQSGDGRDFTANPINLETEITGILSIGNVDVSSIQDQIDSATEDISEYETRITALESEKHFNWRGQFQIGNTYNTYDVVRAEDGNDYIATADGLVLSPPSSGWDLFLEGGNGDTPTLPENIATIEDIDDKISEHNLNEDSHQDIRDLIANIDIPEIPENVSEFTNDAGYVTSVPYDDEEIDTEISLIRDFFENPIDLGTEVTGKLSGDNIDVSALTGLIPAPILHQTTGQDELGGMSQKATTDMVNTFGAGENITCNMVDLQTTIDSLPKFLNRSITINVNSGDYSGTITIKGFSGAGALVIVGATTELAVTHSVYNINIVSCTNSQIQIRGINCTSTTGNAINVNQITCGLFYVYQCNMTGGINTDSANVGVQINDCSCHAVIQNTNISNKRTAVLAVSSNGVRVNNLTGINNYHIYFAHVASIIHKQTAGTITGVIETVTQTGGMIIDSGGFRALTTAVVKTIDLSNLQQEIDALPKLLLANVTFNVNPGTVASNITITGFTGSGIIQINGATAISDTHNVSKITVSSCSNGRVNIKGFTSTSISGNCFYVLDCSCGDVNFQFCRAILGAKDTASHYGFFVNGTHLCTITTCEISNKNQAIRNSRGKVITSQLSGTENNLVYNAFSGGIVHKQTEGTITGTTVNTFSQAGLIINSGGGVIG